MKEINDQSLNANLAVDKYDRVRQISHVNQPWESSEPSPLMAAVDYLRHQTELFGVTSAELQDPLEKVSFVDPKQQDVRYRLGQEKSLFDSSTVIFNQTFLNVPVWRAAITLTIKHNPNRVLLAEDTSERGMNAPLPSSEKIKEHKELFALAAAEQRLRVLGLGDQSAAAGLAESDAQPRTAPFVRRILGRNDSTASETAPNDDARAIRGRFFVYHYEAAKRLASKKTAGATPESMSETPTVENPAKMPELSLPPVDPAITDGAWRVVSEFTFTLTTPEYGTLNWRALVDVEKDSVLLLEPLVAGQQGFVFVRDPITSTGDSAITPNRNNTVLNPFRTSVQLPNLNAPTNGTQSLRGRFAVVAEVNQPAIAPPTVQQGTSFDYNVRTNDFAAVNAYYHTDRFFTLIESLGFPIASYFDNTSFPIRVDHRDNVNQTGNTINAWCVGNGAGGIGYAGYALNDLTDTTNPIGRACDSRVHFHELGGHGILYEHVDHPNFGFAHSAGDSLSAIFHDPETRITGVNRFRYAPWNPANDRRFDRSPADGYAWGGTRDDEQYGSEQILCTTMFRIYQAIGGDSTDQKQKQFASRMVMYLILRAISTLTPATNPDNALGFANALMAVDLLNWTSEGVFGGAYNKVIRWSFEKQGLFQAAGAPVPVAQAGQPPAVDVYIDDGRAGEYQYQPNFSSNPSVWNRRAPDGGTTHQEPIAGVANFAYVRIKNRGTTMAQDVRVRGFHHRNAGATVWPIDFKPLTTTELTAGTLKPNGQETKVVGPFEWVPSADALGHDALLMAVSANGDPSNIDNFTAGEAVPEWRLVPNDNNIGLRNVVPAPAQDAPEGPGTGAAITAPAPGTDGRNAIDQLLLGLGFSEHRTKSIKIKSVTFQVDFDSDDVSGTIPLPPAIANTSPRVEAAREAEWGMRRHAAIAAAAQERLQTENARQAITRILDDGGDGSLGEAARWADRLKQSNRPHDPATERFLAELRNRGHNTWHYVNLPLGLNGYDRQQYPQFTRDNDIVQTIRLCVDSLHAPGPGARFEEIIALRWLAHLIGDLHQPVHIGCGYIANPKTNVARLVFSPDDAIGLSSDRGGGALDLPVGHNLHEYWDSVLGPDIVPDPVNAESDDALVRALVSAPAPANFAEAADLTSRIIGWANESLAAARAAYQGLAITAYDPQSEYAVSWEGETSYVQRCAPIVSERMTAAASNLASLLDAIWS